MTSICPSIIEKVDNLLRGASQGDQLVKAVQDVLAVLREGHLLTEMRLNPLVVGVHPLNRDGAGIICSDAHELLDSVLTVGYVQGRVTALAVEITDDSVRKFNEELVRGANGLLGHLDGSRLKVVSLAGSHTNFMLRLIAQGAYHPNSLVSINDRLSMELVGKRDPALATAAQEGLVWQVLNREVAIQWPKLLAMIQSSFNATLQKQETELQLLRRVHTIASQQDKPDFAAVKRAALASKPPCAACLPSIYQFALKFSGGKAGHLLMGTERFLRASGCSTSLGAGFWDQIVYEPRGSVAIPFFRHAVLKLAYSGKAAIYASDVKKIYGKDSLEQAKTADSFISEMRESFTDAGLDLLSPEILQVLSLCEMNMAAKVMGIFLDGEKRHKTLESISHDCVSIVTSVTGIPVVNRWAGMGQETPSVATSSAGAAEPSGSMRELQADGTFADSEAVLKEAGYKVGDLVRRKADRTEFKIASILKRDVRLKSLDDETMSKAPIQAFLEKQFMVFEGRPAPQVLADVSPWSPGNNSEFAASVLMAGLMQEMNQMWQDLDQETVQTKLQLDIKPMRAVRVKEAFKAKKLVLVPATLKVSYKLDGSLPSGALQLDLLGKNSENQSFFISSSNHIPKAEDSDSKGFLALFWAIPTTANEEEATMELCTRKGGRSLANWPILRNKGPLKPMDVLLVHKPPERKVVAALDAASPGAAKRRRVKTS